MTAEGVVQSPNYPGKYPNNHNKTKTIETSNGTVLEFGECCWSRDPIPSSQKLDTRWKDTVWLGKVDLSDEHICVVGDKAEKIRSVRRRPESERWDRSLLSGIKANP